MSKKTATRGNIMLWRKTIVVKIGLCALSQVLLLQVYRTDHSGVSLAAKLFLHPTMVFLQ